MRKLLAVVAGVIAGALVVAVLEALGHQVYPPPAGIDMTNADTARQMMIDAPAGALLFVLGAWALGALAAGWTVARLAHEQRMPLALIAGAILLAGAVTTLVMLPHPLWFTIAGPLVMLPMTALGARLAR